MNKKSLLLGIIILIVIGGIFFITTREKPSTTGPIQSHRLYTLKSNSRGKIYFVKTPSEYSFSIVDEQRTTLKDFTITHTKPMHVIVVRKDIAYFQHVHPEFDQSTGTFTLKDLIFPADGEYRIFADFAANDGQKDSTGMPLVITLSEDVQAGADYKPVAIGTEEKTKTFDGYHVTLATQGTLTSGTKSVLGFTISQNDTPVTDLEQYLGALGHSVILREGTLDFIHAHPREVQGQNSTMSFMVNFPEDGKYKVFTQFQRGGKVFTIDFVVSVAHGVNMPDTNMPDMDYSIH